MSEQGPEHVSRRGLLKKAGGAVAAGVAGAAIGGHVGAAPAGAATGDFVTLGQPNFAAVPTGIINSSTASEGLFGVVGNGVIGTGSDNGVVGRTKDATGGVGVQGLTKGHYSQTAVLGDTATLGNGEGIAVHGLTKNGVGLLGEASGGYALQVKGRAVFSRSGKVAIAAGQASRSVAAPLIANSLVLATIQSAVAATWILGVQLDVAHGRFTIRLNKAAPVNLTVGWFVVN